MSEKSQVQDRVRNMPMSTSFSFWNLVVAGLYPGTLNSPEILVHYLSRLKFCYRAAIVAAQKANSYTQSQAIVKCCVALKINK